MAPEYGSSLYWETRFKSDPAAFEWLVKPDCFHDPVRFALQVSAKPQPKVLHIGCGSSELSYHLRFLVEQPAQVHNVDFSDAAVALGRKHDDRDKPMHWKAVDLLNDQHIYGLRDDLEPHKCFSLIVDKGTADSVACGYPKALGSQQFDIVKQVTKRPSRAVAKEMSADEAELSTRSKLSSGSKLSPEALLALNLAYLTHPGSQWICVSFSASRFEFLDELQAVQSPHDSGEAFSFLISDLWSLETRRSIEAEQNIEEERDHPVYRPKIEYWLYTLKRRG